MTSPDVPPPLKFVPATTDVISPTVVENTPLVAVIPVPAIAVAMSANDSFLELLSDASIIATLSFAISTDAAVNSFRSTASDTVPLVPPPESPSPAVTPSMSPVSASLVTVNVPAESSYDNDIPEPAVSKEFTWSSIASNAAVPKAAFVKSPELSITSVEPTVHPFFILKFCAATRMFLRQLRHY